MNDKALQMMEEMQKEGLKKCREMLYSSLSENGIPMKFMSAVEDIVESAYRLGIETEADIVITLSKIK